MKSTNITSYLFAFLLLFGTAFIVQCDRDTQQADRDDQYQTEQDIAVDEQDRRYDGTAVEGTADARVDHDIEYDDRDDLVDKMEDLRDDLDEKMEDQDAAQHETEQIQNDRTELDRLIREVETASEENWHNVRMEAIQSYETIAARYDNGYGERTDDGNNW